MAAVSDLRYALRLLIRTPVFTATSVLSLAIGIAATTAIFSLADALLLRAQPGVADPATLVDIGRSTGGVGLDNYGYPLFEAFRDRSTTIARISATQFTPNVMALGDATQSERIFASLVSHDYFSLIGVRAAAGRFFLPEEDRTRGTHPVVVLSHEFWTRRFGADPSLIGQTIRLNNLPYTVIGVAEPGFRGTTAFGTDSWIPMAMDAHVRASDTSFLDRHEIVWMTSIGRLKPGVSIEQARQELGAIMKAYLTERNDPRAERWTIAVSPATRVPAGLSGPVTGFIGVLAVLTGLVLLIACSNVAAMLLARAIDRRREVATRLAVGASRARVLGQLLVEGLALALVAGAISVPLTAALVRMLMSSLPSLPIPVNIELQTDARVMLFAFGIAATTSVLFALMPALQATRFELAPALHGQNATGDRRRAWLRHCLVTAQVAMALLLLVAAGLFLRSLQEAANTDVGFEVDGIDTLQIDTRVGGYRTDEEGVRVVEALLDRFRTVPGVTAAGASRMVPLFSGNMGLGALRVPGYTGGRDGSDEVVASWDVVTPGYFDTLGIAITRGRAFDARDRQGASTVAIVNERMAETLWPGEDPIGRQLIQQAGRNESRTLEVIGVASNARYVSLSEPPRNFIYVPHAQQFMSDMTFYVRRADDGSRLAELRRAVIDFDPNLPVLYTQTLEETTAFALLPQRIAGWIAGSVSMIGLLLAALGLYGLTAFAVAQRTREIAVRMALGATRETVVSLVIRQSGRTALIGAGIGLALAAGVSQLLRTLLIGIDAIDPIAFGVATLLLVGVLLVATWIPARRAAGLDPMRALRAE